jgi:hypothetical protein
MMFKDGAMAKHAWTQEGGAKGPAGAMAPLNEAKKKSSIAVPISTVQYNAHAILLQCYMSHCM